MRVVEASISKGSDPLEGLGDEDDVEAVGVLEREAVLGPVWVGRANWLPAEASGDVPDRLVVADVEEEERFGVRLRSAVAAAGCELEVSARLRYPEEHAVVAVVVVEASYLGKAETVAVEPDDLVETFGVTRDAQLHQSGQR